ncbi:MAG TPA: hypothetical protein VLA56_22245 [Pseudomonadales bacterium]|nr:hypothetical protein [Pseudomonadales bacterium]
MNVMAHCPNCGARLTNEWRSAIRTPVSCECGARLTSNMASLVPSMLVLGVVVYAAAELRAVLGTLGAIAAAALAAGGVVLALSRLLDRPIVVAGPSGSASRRDRDD